MTPKSVLECYHLVFLMRWGAVLICVALVPCLAAPTKKSPHNKPKISAAGKSAARTAASAGSGRGAKSRSRRGGRRAARAKPAPSFQLHPETERYQQIQESLADRGYFKGETNGQWNEDSVDALRRFQMDQKLPDPEGKLDALSLTALGLGPKHGAAASGSAAPPPSLTSAVPPPAPTEIQQPEQP